MPVIAIDLAMHHLLAEVDDQVLVEAQLGAAALQGGRRASCAGPGARRLFCAHRAGVRDFLQQGAFAGEPLQGFGRRRRRGLHLQGDRALAAGPVVVTGPAAFLAFVDRACRRRA